LHLGLFLFISNIFINFRLKLVYLKETQTNMYELEHVKYICVEINMSQNMKNCKYISKLRLWILEFCSDFFCDE